MRTLIDADRDLSKLGTRGKDLFFQGEIDSFEKVEEYCNKYLGERDAIIVPKAVVRYDVYFKTGEKKNDSNN